ncbi:hypothetical protein ANN_27340 [Periplaneta americana]|uniref:Per a allergen n=1 Tax=Periplaneta americana TaxID=6978 RepID=A0ABQ8RXW8_PERAM|nr:hypothetical protein ANN_27340 [Periplaneta americana]
MVGLCEGGNEPTGSVKAICTANTTSAMWTGIIMHEYKVLANERCKGHHMILQGPFDEPLCIEGPLIDDHELGAGYSGDASHTIIELPPNRVLEEKATDEYYLSSAFATPLLVHQQTLS